MLPSRHSKLVALGLALVLLLPTTSLGAAPLSPAALTDALPTGAEILAAEQPPATLEPDAPRSPYLDPALQSPTAREAVRAQLAAPFLPGSTAASAAGGSPRDTLITPRKMPPAISAQPAASLAPRTAPSEQIAWGPERERPSATGSAYGYTLTLNDDMLATETTESFTITLTRFGAPVMGATIEVGTRSEYGVYYTDEAGQVSLSITAPTFRQIIPIYVFDDYYSGPLGEIYAVPPGFGVIVVEGMTEPDSTPISRFDLVTQSGGTMGLWATSRFTATGSVGVIQPAGLTDVTVLALDAATPYYLFQQVNLSTGERRVLNPSTTETVELTVQASLDGFVQEGDLYLRPSEGADWVWQSFALPPTLHVTPGTYTVDFLGGFTEPDPMLLSRSGVVITEATTVTFAETTASLARLQFSLSDSHGAIPITQSITLQNPTQQLFLLDYADLLVTPGLPYQVVSYDVERLSEAGSWHYHFHSSDRPAVTPVSGEAITWELGGPLSLSLSLTGCTQPSCTLSAWPTLETAAGDVLGPVWTPLGEMLKGSFQIRDSDGLLVHDGVADVQGLVQWPIPNTATLGSTYTVSFSYDLGPYQGALSQEALITVGTQVVGSYNLTLSEQVVDPDDAVAITALVTKSDGTAAAGARLEVGYGGEYGSFTVDGTGQAMLRFDAPGWSDEIPIRLYDETGKDRGKLSEIYVVPEGFGVLLIENVTDQNGAPVGFWSANIYHFFPNGSRYLHGGFSSQSSSVGLVRPAGLNHLEVRANGSLPLFLYQQVNVPAKAIQRVQPSGTDAVLVEVTASVDGTERTGSALFHNESLPSSTFVSYASDSPSAYVTPGTYTVLFVNQSADSPLLLRELDVDLTSATTVTLSRSSTDLGTLRTSGTDGQGAPIDLPYAFWLLPSFELALRGSRDYQIEPGLSIGIDHYRMERATAPGTTWQYNADVDEPVRTTETAAGVVRELALGGPVNYRLAYHSGCLEAGCTAYFETGLYNALGDRITVLRNDQFVDGSLTLRDSAGTVVATYAQASGDSGLALLLPADATGSYTLTADFDLGPYQEPVQLTYPFQVAEPVAVTLSQQVIPVKRTSTVEVWVKQGETPVAGAAVRAGYDPSEAVYTDATGHASLTLRPDWISQIPITVTGAGVSETRANLFALSSAYAAVEVTGSDEQGAPLTNYWATVESVESTDFTMNSWSNGPIGLIIPAGEAYVELVREGSPFYLLGRSLTLQGGALTPVHLSAESLTPTLLTATLDGAPLAGGTVAFHQDESSRQIWLDGATLDDAGTATAFITPGLYDLQVQRTWQTEPLVATYRDLALTGGALSLPLQRQELGEVAAHLTVAGVEVPHRWALRTPEFDADITSTEPVVLATPDTYVTDYLTFDLAQTSGAPWQYTMERAPAPYTVRAGERSSFWWTAEVAEARAWATPSTYRGGELIHFGMDLLTADGWRLTHVWGDLPLAGAVGYTITDAGGATVEAITDASIYGNLFITPEEPSPSYTFTLSRDLGRLGTHTGRIALLEQPTYEIALGQTIVPVGSLAVVPITVTQNGRPAQNLSVTLTGETTRTVRLDQYGRGNLPIKATRTGLWSVTIGASTATLFALEPGYGVVDLAATDREGAPLITALLNSPAIHSTVDQEGRLSAIMRAGRQRVVVRGAAANYENYYMLQEVDVPDRGRTLLQADGSQTEAVAVSVTGSAENARRYLLLQQSEAPETEWQSLPLSLRESATVYVTPGQYQALLSVYAYQERSSYYLTSGPFNSAGSATLSFDLADASAELRISGEGSQGAPAYDVGIWITQSGMGRWIGTAEFDRVFLTPGTYVVEGSQLSLGSPTGELWTYQFRGNASIELAADAATPLALGGPLTASIAPAAPVNPAGTTAKLVGGARDANGLLLAWADVATAFGQHLRTVSNQVTISQGSYSYTLLYNGDTALWPTPTTQGIYNLQFAREAGPYGPIPTASGQVRVTAPLVRFRP